MSSLQAAPAHTIASRPGVFRAFAIVAHVVVVLVLVQAVLAGRGQFNDSFKNWHEMVGNLVLLLALAQFVLLFVAGVGGAMKRALLGTSLLLFVLIIAQLGLGYAGRDHREMQALHLPNGVLVFGLGVANVSLIARARREGT